MCFIVFIMHTKNDDTIMRGRLMSLAFQTLGLACQTKLFDTESWFGDLVKQNRTLADLASNGVPKPWICYYVKEGSAPEMDLCHRHGAINMYDVIDNDKRSGVFPGEYGGAGRQPGRDHYGQGLTRVHPVSGVDLWLVNTKEHADMLTSNGLRALALPHPHSNFRVFDAPPEVDFSKVGLMASQLANMPSNETLVELGKQSCAAGKQLVLISSSAKGVNELRCPGPYCPELSCNTLGVSALGDRWGNQGACARFAPSARDESRRHGYTPPPRGIRNSSDTHAHGARDRVALESMRTRDQISADQERFYDVAKFPGPMPAVAIMWEPFGGRMFMSRARPQTRQVWWWSLGVPTIGSRALGSAQDAGRRAGMLELHSLRLENVTDALLCVSNTPGLWHDLRKRAMNDARHASSLLAAARELQTVVLRHRDLSVKPATGSFRRWMCPPARRKGLHDPACASCDAKAVLCKDAYVAGT